VLTAVTAARNTLKGATASRDSVTAFLDARAATVLTVRDDNDHFPLLQKHRSHTFVAYVFFFELLPLQPVLYLLTSARLCFYLSWLVGLFVIRSTKNLRMICEFL